MRKKISFSSENEKKVFIFSKKMKKSSHFWLKMRKKFSFLVKNEKKSSHFRVKMRKSSHF